MSPKSIYNKVFGPANDYQFNLPEHGNICYREIISQPTTGPFWENVVLVNEKESGITDEVDGMGKYNWDKKYKKAVDLADEYIPVGDKIIQAHTYCDDDLLALMNDYYDALVKKD